MQSRKKAFYKQKLVKVVMVLYSHSINIIMKRKRR